MAQVSEITLTDMDSNVRLFRINNASQLDVT